MTEWLVSALVASFLFGTAYFLGEKSGKSELDEFRRAAREETQKALQEVKKEVQKVEKKYLTEAKEREAKWMKEVAPFIRDAEQACARGGKTSSCQTANNKVLAAVFGFTQ